MHACCRGIMRRKTTSLTVLPVCKIFLNRIHQHYLGNNSVDAGRGGEIWFHVINISWNLDIFTNFIGHLIEKPAVVNSIDWWTDLELNRFFKLSDIYLLCQNSKVDMGKFCHLTMFMPGQKISHSQANGYFFHIWR